MNLTNESFDLKKSHPKELLEHLILIVSNKEFLNKNNPNNEVPFYICPFLLINLFTLEGKMSLKDLRPCINFLLFLL